MALHTANGRVNGEAVNRLGYIDLISPEEVERVFSIDKLKINFLKHPLKSPRRAVIKYLHKHSKIGRDTIENPGSWKILDRLYGNEPEGIETVAFVPEHLTDKMFYNSKAARATRARFVEYVEQMKKLGKEYAESNNGKVDILSLASGPGRDVIEAVEFLKEEGIDVYATCIDKCKDAMELGSNIAKNKGLKNITFKRGKIGKMHHYENGNSYDIVITQGIMDYLDDERSINLLRNSKEVSREEGTLITSNMDMHMWMRFWMEFFGRWKLNYRGKQYLEDLMIKAGYDKDNMSLYLLPEGYHWIGIGKK